MDSVTQEQYELATAAVEEIKPRLRATQPPEVVAVLEEVGFNPELAADRAHNSGRERRSIGDQLFDAMRRGDRLSPIDIANRLAEMMGSQAALTDMSAVLRRIRNEPGNIDHWDSLEAMIDPNYGENMLNVSPQREPRNDPRFMSLTDDPLVLEQFRRNYLHGYEATLASRDRLTPGWMLREAHAQRPGAVSVSRWSLPKTRERAVATAYTAASDKVAQITAGELSKMAGHTDQLTARYATALDLATKLAAIPNPTPEEAAEQVLRSAYTDYTHAADRAFPYAGLTQAQEVFDASLGVREPPRPHWVIIREAVPEQEIRESLARYDTRVREVETQLADLTNDYRFLSPSYYAGQTGEALGRWHAMQHATFLIDNLQRDPARRFDPNNAGVTDNWAALIETQRPHYAQNQWDANQPRQDQLRAIVGDEHFDRARDAYLAAYNNSIRGLVSYDPGAHRHLRDAAALMRVAQVNSYTPDPDAALRQALGTIAEAARGESHAAMRDAQQVAATVETRLELERITTDPVAIEAIATGQEQAAVVTNNRSVA